MRDLDNDSGASRPAADAPRTVVARALAVCLRRLFRRRGAPAWPRFAALVAFGLWIGGAAQAATIYEIHFDVTDPNDALLHVVPVGLAGAGATVPPAPTTITYEGSGSGTLIFLGATVSVTEPDLTWEVTIPSMAPGIWVALTLTFTDGISLNFSVNVPLSVGTNVITLASLGVVVPGTAHVAPSISASGSSIQVTLDHFRITNSVPEPGTLILLGVAGLWAVGRRRRPR